MSVTKARDFAISLFGTFWSNNIFTAESISKSIFLSFFEGPITIVISPFKSVSYTHLTLPTTVRV